MVFVAGFGNERLVGRCRMIVSVERNPGGSDGVNRVTSICGDCGRATWMLCDGDGDRRTSDREHSGRCVEMNNEKGLWAISWSGLLQRLLGSWLSVVSFGKPTKHLMLGHV